MASAKPKKPFPVALRPIKPDYCGHSQCGVIKRTAKECRETNRKIEEIMPIAWEIDPECMMCQDADFADAIASLTEIKSSSSAGINKRARKKNRGGR